MTEFTTIPGWCVRVVVHDWEGDIIKQGHYFNNYNAALDCKEHLGGLLIEDEHVEMFNISINNFYINNPLTFYMTGSLDRSLYVDAAEDYTVDTDAICGTSRDLVLEKHEIKLTRHEIHYDAIIQANSTQEALDKLQNLIDKALENDR